MSSPGVLSWEEGSSLDLGPRGLSRADSRMSRVVMVGRAGLIAWKTWSTAWMTWMTWMTAWMTWMTAFLYI